jgi:hypothetical protein
MHAMCFCVGAVVLFGGLAYLRKLEWEESGACGLKP